MKLLLRLAINAVALWVAATYVPGLDFEGDLLGLVVVAIVFGLVNALIRPLVKMLSLPLRVLTLGLFTLVINAAMLMITVGLTEAIRFNDAEGNRYLAALLGAIVISLISMVLSWILPDDK